MDYDKLGNKILELDKSVRFVEIYHKGKRFRKLRDNLDSLLTPEQTEESINDAIMRWKTRVNLSDRLGEPIFAMAKYKNVTRITVPFGKDGLVLVSLDPKGYHEVIIETIIDILNQLSE